MAVEIENVETGRVNINLNLFIYLIFVNPLLLDRPGIAIVGNVDKGFRAADFSEADARLKFDVRSGSLLQLQMVSTHTELIIAGF